MNNSFLKIIQRIVRYANEDDELGTGKLKCCLVFKRLKLDLSKNIFKKKKKKCMESEKVYPGVWHRSKYNLIFQRIREYFLEMKLFLKLILAVREGEG